MIRRIAHEAIKVKDLSQSIQFYTDILGFQKAFQIHNEEGKISLVYLYIGEGQFIELFPDGREESPFNPSAVGHSHICYEVEDIHNTVKILTEKGVSMDNEIRKGKSGCLQCWIHDPDGNRIELMELPADSLQAKAIKEFADRNSEWNV